MLRKVVKLPSEVHPHLQRLVFCFCVCVVVGPMVLGLLLCFWEVCERVRDDVTRIDSRERRVSHE